jgi:hypothetical protein
MILPTVDASVASSHPSKVKRAAQIYRGAVDVRKTETETSGRLQAAGVVIIFLFHPSQNSHLSFPPRRLPLEPTITPNSVDPLDPTATPHSVAPLDAAAVAQMAAS